MKQSMSKLNYIYEITNLLKKINDQFNNNDLMIKSLTKLDHFSLLNTSNLTDCSLRTIMNIRTCV